MAGGDATDVDASMGLPMDIPDLAIKCVEESFNAAYHVRLNGIALAGFAGRIAAGGAVKADLEKSITKMADIYIQYAMTNPDATPLDEVMAKQLYGAIVACRDGGAPMRLDVVIMNQGSSNGNIEYSLYNDGRAITDKVHLKTKPYAAGGADTEKTILARTEGVSGHVTYAASIVGPRRALAWEVVELERNSYTPRTVGMWLKRASPV